MAVREVLLYPDPGLKRVAAPAPVSAQLDELVVDLIDTMRAYPGCVGLAGPQLGIDSRVFVIDLTEHRKAPLSVHGLLVLVDPVVEQSSGSEIAREGCLSIPQLTANVRRATEITVSASQPHGDRVTFTFDAFEARCVLHEIDHLDGILFLDRVDSLTTDVFARKARAS